MSHLAMLRPRDRLSGPERGDEANARARLNHPSVGLRTSKDRGGAGRQRVGPTLRALNTLLLAYRSRREWTATVGILGAMAGYGRCSDTHASGCQAHGGGGQCMAHARRAVHDHLQLLVAAKIIRRAGYHPFTGATVWRWCRLYRAPTNRPATILDDWADLVKPWDLPLSVAKCQVCGLRPVARSPRGPPDRACRQCWRRRAGWRPCNNRYPRDRNFTHAVGHELIPVDAYEDLMSGPPRAPT